MILRKTSSTMTIVNPLLSGFVQSEAVAPCENFLSQFDDLERLLAVGALVGNEIKAIVVRN